MMLNHTSSTLLPRLFPTAFFHPSAGEQQIKKKYNHPTRGEDDLLGEGWPQRCVRKDWPEIIKNCIFWRRHRCMGYRPNKSEKHGVESVLLQKISFNFFIVLSQIQRFIRVVRRNNSSPLPIIQITKIIDLSIMQASQSEVGGLLLKKLTDNSLLKNPEYRKEIEGSIARTVPVIFTCGTANQHYFWAYESITMREFIQQLALSLMLQATGEDSDEYTHQAHPKAKYSKTSMKKKQQLIDLVANQQWTIYKASKKLKLSNSTAKSILRNFQKYGTLLEKFTKNRILKLRQMDRTQENSHKANNTVKQEEEEQQASVKLENRLEKVDESKISENGADYYPFYPFTVPLYMDYPLS